MIPEHVVKNEELRDKIIELICDNNFIKKIPPEISTCEQMVSESRGLNNINLKHQATG